MSQLVLPNSIDAGTPVAAAEVQGNFVAIRDLINGNIEGGSGVTGNIKADGITARELDNNMLNDFMGLSGTIFQEGVISAGDFRVTPGAGLALNYAQGYAVVKDDTGVIAAGALLPVFLSSGSVSVASNASGNPRIDQVILTITGWRAGTVSVLQGTATVGATLDNRSGAAALPNNAVRLADVLMPNGFAGPFVQATHIRDRRPWARGGVAYVAGTGGGDFSTASVTFQVIPSMDVRMEVTSGAIEVIYTGLTWNGTAGQSNLLGVLTTFGGSTTEFGGANQGRMQMTSPAANESDAFALHLSLGISAGSWLFQPAVAVVGGTAVVANSANTKPRMLVREIMNPYSSANGGLNAGA